MLYVEWIIRYRLTDNVRPGERSYSGCGELNGITEGVVDRDRTRTRRVDGDRSGRRTATTVLVTDRQLVREASRCRVGELRILQVGQADTVVVKIPGPGSRRCKRSVREVHRRTRTERRCCRRIRGRRDGYGHIDRNGQRTSGQGSARIADDQGDVVRTGGEQLIRRRVDRTERRSVSVEVPVPTIGCRAVQIQRSIVDDRLHLPQAVTLVGHIEGSVEWNRNRMRSCYGRGTRLPHRIHTNGESLHGHIVNTGRREGMGDRTDRSGIAAVSEIPAGEIATVDLRECRGKTQRRHRSEINTVVHDAYARNRIADTAVDGFRSGVGTPERVGDGNGIGRRTRQGLRDRRGRSAGAPEIGITTGIDRIEGDTGREITDLIRRHVHQR